MHLHSNPTARLFPQAPEMTGRPLLPQLRPEQSPTRPLFPSSTRSPSSRSRQSTWPCLRWRPSLPLQVSLSLRSSPSTLTWTAIYLRLHIPLSAFCGADARAEGRRCVAQVTWELKLVAECRWVQRPDVLRPAWVPATPGQPAGSAAGLCCICTAWVPSVPTPRLR